MWRAALPVARPAALPSTPGVNLHVPGSATPLSSFTEASIRKLAAQGREGAVSTNPLGTTAEKGRICTTKFRKYHTTYEWCVHFIHLLRHHSIAGVSAAPRACRHGVASGARARSREAHEPRSADRECGQGEQRRGTQQTGGLRRLRRSWCTCDATSLCPGLAVFRF